MLPLYLLAFSIFLIYFYFRQKFSYWKKKGVPYMPPKTPLAKLKPIIEGKECITTNVASVYKYFQERNLKYGGYFILTDPVLCIADPDMLKHLLVTEFNAFNERGMFVDEKKEPLSTHMFAIGYEKWHFLRKKFSPTFTPSKMKTMFPFMLKCGKNLTEYLEGAADRGPVDMYEILACFTTDNIVSCAFGLESDCFKNPDAEFRSCGKRFASKSVAQSLSMALALYTPWVLKILNQTYIDPRITKFFLKVLRETVDFREKNNVEREDMLNLLIKLKNNESIEDGLESDGIAISFNDLAAQAFIFFLGGFETSATTLTFTLYELCLKEDIQVKLRKEVKEVTRKHGGQITYESINEMAYMDQIIHESLRMYPPIGMINRVVSQDVKIPGTDVVLEKGTAVVGSILGIHMDPRFYENPLTFDPERFTEKRRHDIKPGTYIPFGLGPKGCIGMRFALQQTKIGLAMLIDNFEFTLDPKTKVPLDFSPISFVNVFDSTLWLQVRKIKD